ncbi:hypothetical protein [Sphingosinicella sp. BN140058]|uniref:hypothetical protein n=1 Tax=Sphingosinicella sp. BN140058 TaxID=1892855 RepID=UPI001012279D|nr:hypothetical protein [Sphingosinicella sp. BN140058]QAY80300.1 hypothetical protein ETR14_27030 [Sphingosinicella sp. BN140058]
MSNTPADASTAWRAPADYTPARDGTASFYFLSEPSYPCFAHGTHWNGFDNVSISPETREIILADWELQRDTDLDTVADLRELSPDHHGRIDLAGGFATELDRPSLAPST